MEKLIQSLGNCTAVIGAQWGDEGKGKVVDMLADRFDVIARACGGANAGHTIVVNGKKHVFRLLPSGSLHDAKAIVLGAGMVIHLPTLLEEIQLLKDAGIDLIPRLFISSSAHIVFDYHKEIDAVLEEARSKTKAGGIGTTKRGIGPAYMDKAARSGLRMEALALRTNFSEQMNERANMVKKMFGVAVDVQKELSNINEAQKMIGQRIFSTADLLQNQLNADRRILIEGAQATLLDIDHGSYPYVTSSSTTAAGALQGLGLPPSRLRSVIGVAKAYCTRVGSGDFPTEVTGEAGDRLRERGGEFGSVTGRPRRCGWLSLPDLKFAALINGFDCWNITKLDVLDTEDVIPVGMGTENGKLLYRELKGWKTPTQGITDFKKLPMQAQQYIGLIEAETGIPVRLIGTGQGRGDMIIR